MTKAQIWMAGFLVLFLLLFILERATMNETKESSLPIGNTQTQTTQTQQLSGEDLINNSGCKSCHGENLTGTNLAPTLYGLQSFYDRDKLINYLRNPNSFMDSDRFKNYKEKYKNIVMPSYNNIDVKNLGIISDYLLNLK